MNKIEGKHCPLVNKPCLLDLCTLFNERLDGCEISILNYNLYQLKERIRAILNLANGASDCVISKNPRYPKQDF